VACTPDCNGKECGDNGCGGMCGTCGEGWICKDGVCQEDVPCEPNCLNKECGDNGCGNPCGSCGIDQKCSPSGMCVAEDVVFDIVVPDPDVTVGENEPGGDSDSPWSESDQSNGKGNGDGTGLCPEGSTYVWGQCLPDETTADEGGCSVSASPPPASTAGFALLFAVLLLGLFLIRETA